MEHVNQRTNRPLQKQRKEQNKRFKKQLQF